MTDMEVKITALIPHKSVDVFLHADILKVKIINTDSTVSISLNDLNRHPKKIFGANEATEFAGQNIIALYEINGIKVFLITRNNAIYILKNNGFYATGYDANLKTFATSNNVYFYGKFTHRARSAFMKYEYLYLGENTEQITKFVRPFAKVKFFKKFGFFKVPFKKMAALGEVHQRFYVGNEKIGIYNLRLNFQYEQSLDRNQEPKSQVLKKFGQELLAIRTTQKGNTIRSMVQYTPEYSRVNRIKIAFANLFAKMHTNKKNVNLYFEKQSTTAAESGFRVFEQVMKEHHEKSVNYFVLDKNSKDYSVMKSKYQDKVLAKYSFRHYYYIFKADYFISSELSKHVLNDRVLISSLHAKIVTVPLIFLQHGITFAKPVETLPFHKKRMNNVYKNVIGSQLEANEFYKMGYTDEDLILTGMATFDFAKLNDDADKITYMPTYRRWEQRLIYNNKIEETSYYRSIMRVINAFEAKGIVDQLLICPHNKFSEFIYQNMPQYQHIIAKNPSDALKISKIFITDFSSAIYDAQYRGSYPIFYWEDKDFLLSHWKANPPVNEDNAPGPIAMTIEELIDIVNHVQANDYVVEDEYQAKYLQINQFNDNKNTERIVKFLKDDGIL